MTSSTPAAEHRIQGLVTVIECLNTQDMAVVCTPPPDLRVQSGDEGFLGRASHPPYRCVQVRDVALDGLFARRNAHQEPGRYLAFQPTGSGTAGPVLANRKAQEIQAHSTLVGIEGMSDPGLRRAQVQAHVCQPLLHDRLGGRDPFQIATHNDEVG